MALASTQDLSDADRADFLESTRIRLQSGDIDFAPPVFHDLRHTAVSLYLAVTKNVKHVQRIAGHKDATTTLNVYAELCRRGPRRPRSGLAQRITHKGACPPGQGPRWPSCWPPDCLTETGLAICSWARQACSR
ncbi:tyrosine-type recombinase/integrase [Sinomonas sp. B1-1]|uniref:tyrosine-type recombinase/integrase n=1 Tax=Sinomonas sp. B1-1 TaxID=3141454 RepID=UPI003D291510